MGGPYYIQKSSDDCRRRDSTLDRFVPLKAVRRHLSLMLSGSEPRFQHVFLTRIQARKLARVQNHAASERESVGRKGTSSALYNLDCWSELKAPRPRGARERTRRRREEEESSGQKSGAEKLLNVCAKADKRETHSVQLEIQ